MYCCFRNLNFQQFHYAWIRISKVEMLMKFEDMQEMLEMRDLTLKQNWSMEYCEDINNQCWRWRQYFSLKCLYLPVCPHGITTQKTNINIFTTGRTSNLIHINNIFITRHKKNFNCWWRIVSSFSKQAAALCIVKLFLHQKNKLWNYVNSLHSHCLLRQLQLLGLTWTQSV
jgi:hypothetical protein